MPRFSKHLLPMYLFYKQLDIPGGAPARVSTPSLFRGPSCRAPRGHHPRPLRQAAVTGEAALYTSAQSHDSNSGITLKANLLKQTFSSLEPGKGVPKFPINDTGYPTHPFYCKDYFIISWVCINKDPVFLSIRLSPPPGTLSNPDCSSVPPATLDLGHTHSFTLLPSPEINWPAKALLTSWVYLRFPKRDSSHGMVRQIIPPKDKQFHGSLTFSRRHHTNSIYSPGSAAQIKVSFLLPVKKNTCT